MFMIIVKKLLTLDSRNGVFATSCFIEKLTKSSTLVLRQCFKPGFRSHLGGGGGGGEIPANDLCDFGSKTTPDGMFR